MYNDLIEVVEYKNYENMKVIDQFVVTLFNYLRMPTSIQHLVVKQKCNVRFDPTDCSGSPLQENKKDPFNTNLLKIVFN